MNRQPAMEADSFKTQRHIVSKDLNAVSDGFAELRAVLGIYSIRRAEFFSVHPLYEEEDYSSIACLNLALKCNQMLEAAGGHRVDRKSVV